MIVSFSVSNFRSFASEETLSLVASNRLSGSHDDHTVPIPDSEEKVLRAAVIYGANGAGKSNLFKALRYLKSVALGPRKTVERQPFRFTASPDGSSSFDLQFIAGGKLYRFGLKANDSRIIEEWLFQVVKGQQRLLYERTTDENGRVAIDAEGLKGAGDKVQALATVGGPQNQSFLATVNATLNVGDFEGELSQVLGWFGGGLTLVGPDESFGALGHLLNQDPGFRSFAGAFLESAATGVDRLEVLKKEISNDEIRGLLPDGVAPWALRDLAEGEEGVSRVVVGGNELFVERKRGKTSFHQISIQSAHEHEPGRVVRLDLAEESDGTRRLLNLIPALHDQRAAPAVYFIDEIDRSLHPILVRKFLEYFLKSSDGRFRQILATTHESNLLDQDLLRRDEIWFAEKDPAEATRLYSLVDFKIRTDPEIRKHYLQGRFGAVPFLGDLENLMAKTDPQK